MNLAVIFRGGVDKGISTRSLADVFVFADWRAWRPRPTAIPDPASRRELRLGRASAAVCAVDRDDLAREFLDIADHESW